MAEVKASGTTRANYHTVEVIVVAKIAAAKIRAGHTYEVFDEKVTAGARPAACHCSGRKNPTLLCFPKRGSDERIHLRPSDKVTEVDA